MRKTLKFQLLSSIFFISTFGSCSSTPKPNSKILASNDKLYDAVNNMFTFLNDNLEPKKYKNLCNLKFVELSLDLITARNESEQSINSVNKCFSKLFATKEQNVDILEDLKKISDEINKASTARFVVMGNTKDKNHFSKLGKAFQSYGLEYALIAFSDANAKFFFSDYNVANNIFIDDEGNVLDKKGCYEQIKKLGNDVQCIVIPIIHLLLKKESCFVHLGGFSCNSPYSLPMLFSLVGASAYDLKNARMRNNEEKKNNQGRSDNAKNKILRCKEYIYSDYYSLMQMRSLFVQSAGVQTYDIIWNKIISSFIEKNLNYESFGNEKIVFSSESFNSGEFVLTGNKYQCNQVLDACVEQSNGSSKNKGGEDIVEKTFEQFRQYNEKKNELQKQEKKILDEIEQLRKKYDNESKTLSGLQTKEQKLHQKQRVDQITSQLRDKRIKMGEIQNKLKSIPSFNESSFHITRLLKKVQQDRKIEYKSSEGGNYVLDVHGFREDESFSQYFEGGKLKNY